MKSPQSATTPMILTLVSSSLLLLILITVTDVISTKEDVSGHEPLLVVHDQAQKRTLPNPIRVSNKIIDSSLHTRNLG